MEMAFAPATIAYKCAVMGATWGHLAPKRHAQYTGYIICCITSNGDITPIDYDFGGLDDSPWFYQAIIDFIDGNVNEYGTVYRFDGVFVNYEFKGVMRTILTN